MYLALQRYSRPATVDECLRLLHEPGQRAALLAGGTDLNHRGHEDLTHVIDLQALGLGAIQPEGDALRVGAGVTLSRLRRAPELAGPWLAALREAAGAYAVIAMQNRSTLGGRIASDRHDLDLPPALAALGAKLAIVRWQGEKAVETVIDYPTGNARAALSGALVTAVLLPAPGTGASASRRFARTAVDVPLATVSAARRAGTVRLAANVQGPSAADLRRLGRAEALASSWGEAPPAGWRAELRAAASADAASFADPWASGAYRNDLTATLAVRALAACFGEPEIV
jgi:CO/xanthine dehydrogenase FAD-binding subunit